MKVYDAYRLAIQTGMEHDPRPKDEIRRLLDAAKDEYEALPDGKKEYFDQERLWNPFADCRFGAFEEKAKETECERVMWGIDIGPSEVLLADRLRERGERVDAVVAHHPTGKSRNYFPEVMYMQNDIYADCGVPINVSEALMKPRVTEVERNVWGDDFNRAQDLDAYLGFPMFNIHSAADNMVQEYIEGKIRAAEPKRLGDVLDVLMEEPEFKCYSKLNDPPRIVLGSRDDRCGNIIAKMTGGTSGPKEIYAELAKAGVGTMVGMHFNRDAYEECQKHHINLIISGHMSSDSLGVNLICDVWEKEGIEVFGVAGFKRFSRNARCSRPVHA